MPLVELGRIFNDDAARDARFDERAHRRPPTPLAQRNQNSIGPGLSTIRARSGIRPENLTRHRPDRGIGQRSSTIPTTICRLCPASSSRAISPARGVLPIIRIRSRREPKHVQPQLEKRSCHLHRCAASMRSETPSSVETCASRQGTTMTSPGLTQKLSCVLAGRAWPSSTEAIVGKRNVPRVGPSCRSTTDPAARRIVGDAACHGQNVEHRCAILDLVTARRLHLADHGHLEAVNFAHEHGHRGRRDVFGQSGRQLVAQLHGCEACGMYVVEQRQRDFPVRPHRNGPGQRRGCPRPRCRARPRGR